jgi:hypothetical protein
MTVGLRAYANSFAADPRRVRVHFFEVFPIALDWATDRSAHSIDELIDEFARPVHRGGALDAGPSQKDSHRAPVAQATLASLTPGR